MPTNLIKYYNSLLEIDALPIQERNTSLYRVFKRDFIDTNSPSFNQKSITPTPLDGIATMETLFHHLTTKKEYPDKPARVFDRSRSIRLHWVKYHLDVRKNNNMLYFTVKEPEGFRTYVYDRDEEYVVVLEPLRDKTAYYLLSAYKLEGKDVQRKKIERKYNRRWQEIL